MYGSINRIVGRWTHTCKGEWTDEEVYTRSKQRQRHKAQQTVSARCTYKNNTVEELEQESNEDYFRGIISREFVTQETRSISRGENIVERLEVEVEEKKTKQRKKRDKQTNEQNTKTNSEKKNSTKIL